MHSKRIALAITAALGIAIGTSAAALPLKGAKLARSASVSLAKSRATALAARPGVVTDQELEKEPGGSGLRYSFDIRAHGKTYEVGVDARTGKVLENIAEGPHPD